jgi:hypothetical protein
VAKGVSAGEAGVLVAVSPQAIVNPNSSISKKRIMGHCSSVRLKATKAFPDGHSHVRAPNTWLGG